MYDVTKIKVIRRKRITPEETLGERFFSDEFWETIFGLTLPSSPRTQIDIRALSEAEQEEFKNDWKKYLKIKDFLEAHNG